MMNTTINDGDVDVVDVDNGVPSIILHLSMIEKGNIIRYDQISFFIDHFSSANIKTKQILQDNMIALVATLAYDDVSTHLSQQREMNLFQHMAISIDAILMNYSLKDYPMEKVLHLNTTLNN